ncbi:MAG: MBL fold metallo-hydrolase [Ignavibacteria bacterium]|nr:MBL fold metallo-hydrolase [Ignavibacteria bacterium]
MKIHHIRNATFVFETNRAKILVDPMLAPAGNGLPYTLFRHPAHKNPLVQLPPNTDKILENITFAVITHLHPDHLDQHGIAFLISHKIPVVCCKAHENTLRKKRLHILASIALNESVNIMEWEITSIPCQHGTGLIGKLMGTVSGFFLQNATNESIYISSDTILTKEIRNALEILKPGITVIACGGAQLDIGKNILMSHSDILETVTLAPNHVYANHMEALNHCPITRSALSQSLASHELLARVWIPEDGDTRIF